jgi:hypothetical protein
MRKFGLALVLAAALGAGTTLLGSAQAAPVGALGQLGTAADDLNLIEQTQYVYGGRSYCWYATGWKGAGWYRCGYAARRGYGWGGPVGWRGWTYGVTPGVVVRGRYYWGGRYYNNRYREGGRWRYR